MPEKKSKSAKRKARATKKVETERLADEEMRPPESAEDFEHVLRRLIASRDRRSSDTAAR